MNWGFADNTPTQFEAAESITTAQVESPLTPCGVNLNISGGKFSPDVCEFEIIAGGIPCGDDNKCKPDYVIAMSNSNPSIDEINNIVFFNIRDSKSGTYRFDPASGLAEFRGQLIDKGAIARALSGGVITLDPQSGDKVFISFDALFDNGITVQGSGLIGTRQLSAP